MFEKLLEKLLLTYFGTYVHGIDPNNLHVGIWSGDIKIEGVSLNQEKINAMLMAMRLPLRVKFSSLGSLRVIVPWNKLSSQPVDITITDVVLCLELDTRGLVSDVRDFIDAKKSLVQNYCRHVLEQSLGKAGTEDSTGYLKKMLGRILDNIQLNISNIHIRLVGGQQGDLEYRLDSAESEASQQENSHDYGRNKPFACGFCLKSILAYTTDSAWQRKFVDRGSENLLEIRKKVQLNDISVYWEEKNVINLNNFNAVDKRLLLLEVIKRKERRLLSISGEIKFVRNSQPDRPLFCLSTDLEFLKVEMNYLQLKDIINLASLLSEYQDSWKQFKMLEALPNDQSKLQPEFVQEFTRAYESEFKELSETMRNVMLRVDRQLLVAWTKQCMKVIIKRQRVEEVEKEKNKRRWFNFMAGPEQKITEAEERQIDEFVESLLTKDQERGSDAQWLRLDLMVRRGNISVLHSEVRKMAHFEYSGIEFGMCTTKDYRKLDLGLKVGRIQLKYFEFEGKADQIDRVLNSKKLKTSQLQIIRPTSDQTLLQLRVDKQGTSTKIILHTQELEINHDIEVTTFVKELLELRASEEVKSAAWNRVVELQQQAEQESLNKPHQNYQIDATIRAIVLSVMLTKRATLKLGFGEVIARQTNDKETSGAVRGVYILYKELVDGDQYAQHHMLKDLTVKVALSTVQGMELAIDVDRISLQAKDSQINSLMEFADRQSRMFKQNEEAQRTRSEEKCYKKGSLRLLTVFKTWKEYYAVFVGGYLEFYDDDGSQKPEVERFVKGCKVTQGQSPLQIRLESRYTNQIIECSSEAECAEWIAVLQQKIMDMSSNEQLFRKADEEKQEQPKSIEKQLQHSRIIIRLAQLDTELVADRLVYQLHLQGLQAVLRESEFHFEREVRIAVFDLSDMSKKPGSDFRQLLANTVSSSHEQLRKPILIRLEGRKKLHPAYTGQLLINVEIDQLKINFDPAFYLRMIRLFDLPGATAPNMSVQERQNTVLEMAHRLLTSQLFRAVEDTILHSDRIADKSVYMSFDKYKAVHSCIALLKLRTKIKQTRMNFIHNTTGCCNGRLQANGLNVEVNNGNGFLFLNVTAGEAALYDLSSYPRTVNTLTHEAEITPYALLENAADNSYLSFTFSTFEDRKFINSERISTFIGMELDRYTVRYQQQPFMRFIDYLTNQLLGFIMSPDSLDCYDRPPNKDFKFTPYIQAKRKDVEGMLRGLLMPFFAHMHFSFRNINLEFNSHPHMDCLRIAVREVLITNINEPARDRTEPIPEQITRFNKKPYFGGLLSNDYFRERVMQGCWVQRYVISLSEAVIPDKSEPFDMRIDFERLPNQQRGLLFPFLKQRKTLSLLGCIPALRLRLDRKYYNLLNKCLIYNLTFDDEREQYFQHNFKHQRLMDFSDMSNIVRVEHLEVDIVDLGQTLRMGGFEFWFMRDVLMVKRMFVKSKHLALLENRETLVMGEPLESPTDYQFEFSFESEPNFDKKLTVEVQRLKIELQLSSFLKIGGFVVLDADCFPPTTVLSDLPAIVCNVQAKNCTIVLMQNESHCFYALGDIGYIWLRNRCTNHELLKEQHTQRKCADEHGVYTSNVVFLRGLELIKCLASDSLVGLHAPGKDRFRKLSGPIVAFVRINHLLRLNGIHEIYYNTEMEYSLENSSIVISYADVNQLITGMQKKPGSEVSQPEPPKEQPPAPAPAPAAAAPAQNLSQTTHTLIVSNLELQVLLSSPPAPVMLLQLMECKALVKQWRGSTNIQCRLATRLQYWNLKVGQWEPILEDALISTEIKMGSTRQLLIECKESLLLNVSVECVRLIKMLLADISNQSAQTRDKRLSSSVRSFDEGMIERRRQEDRMERMSPYIIRNNLGCALEVDSEEGQLKQMLQSEEQVSYQTTSLQEQASYRSNQPKRVKLVIREEHVLNEIGQIDLDKIKNKVLRIDDGERSYDILFVAEYQEITKCITISSAYVVHNYTEHPMAIGFGDRQLHIQPGQRKPLPYSINFAEVFFELTFPHLGPTKENFKFESKRMIPNYQHYILTEKGSFNCNVECQEDPATKLTAITVSPLFVFRNSLPLTLTLQVMWQQNGNNCLSTVELPTQQQKGFHEFGSRDAVSLRASIKGFQFSQMTKIYDPADRNYRIDRLSFSDYRGTMGAINIKHSRKHRVKKYTFYTEGFLINETPYSLLCYDKGGRLMPGQRLPGIDESNSKVIVLDDVKELSLSLGENEPSCSFSSNLQLKVLGNCGVDLLRDHRLHELAVFISMECIDHAENVYSTVVQIWPRYILINRCNRELHIKQCMGSHVTKVPVQGRVPMEFEHKGKPQMVQMKLDDPDFDWMYSEAVNFKDAASSVLSFSCRGVHDYRLKKCLKLEIVKEFQYNYLLVDEINDPADALIRIENGLKYVRLNVYQSVINSQRPVWIQEKGLEVKENGGEAQYALDYPDLEKKLVVELKFVGPLRSDFDDDRIEVDLSRQSLVQEFRKRNQETGRSYSLRMQLETAGPKATLRFLEKDEELQPDEEEHQDTLHLAVSFKQLGLALIGDNGRQRCQLIFLSLKQFGLIIIERKDLRMIQLKIKCISIENNSNHNTGYPVMLTPWKEHENQKSPRPFLVFLVEQGLKHKSITEIKSMRMCLQPTSIRIDDEFIERLYNFVRSIGNSAGSTVEQVNLPALVNDNVEFAWEASELKNLQSETFIHELEIAKISLIISFSMRPRDSSSNLLIYHILSSFGVALSKISESPITFSHIILHSRNINQIKKQLAESYWGQFKRGIYRIIGSINFFGNPYSLGRYFVEGLVEVVDNPVQGFIKGPIEGTVGILTGGVGLVRNVVAGSFNSFQLISESVSSGLSALSMDQSFIERREKIKNHESPHLFSGLLYGGYSVCTGVELAVTGLYRQPTEGYRTSGMIGGISGTLKAMSGLLTKPLSGLFEGISKTSEGIKNTALMFQDGPRTQRERPPRVFYGQEFHYTNYNAIHSDCIVVLETASTRYLNLVVLAIQTFELQDSLPRVLVVSNDWLCLVDLQRKKLDWQLATNRLSSVRLTAESIAVETKEGDEVVIPTENQDLYEKISHIVYLNSSEVADH